LKGTWNIILPKSIEEYELGLNKRVRYNLSHREKMAKRNYKLEVCSKVNKKYLWMFYMLHEKRWGSRWTKGRLRKFLDYYIDALGDAVWLDILLFNDSPGFASLGVECGDIVYSALSGYDITYKKYGPGIFLHYCKVKTAIQRGFVEYDFMKGDSSYKQSLGAQKRSRYTLKRSEYA